MKILCPHCEQRLSCDDKFAGLVIRCPACSEALELPEAGHFVQEWGNQVARRALEVLF